MDPTFPESFGPELQLPGSYVPESHVPEGHVPDGTDVMDYLGKAGVSYAAVSGNVDILSPHDLISIVIGAMNFQQHRPTMELNTKTCHATITYKGQANIGDIYGDQYSVKVITYPKPEPGQGLVELAELVEFEFIGYKPKNVIQN